MEIAIGEIENKIRSTEERINQAQERFYEKQIQETKMNDKVFVIVCSGLSVEFYIRILEYGYYVQPLMELANFIRLPNFLILLFFISTHQINSYVAEYMEICQKLELVGVHGADTNEFVLTSDRADIEENVRKLLTKIRVWFYCCR